MKNIQRIKKQKRLGYISNKHHIKRNPSVERHTSVNQYSAFYPLIQLLYIKQHLINFAQYQ